MRAFRFALVLLALASNALGQNLDRLAATVAFVYKPHVGSGTAFFASADGTTLILVTAEHVSSVLKSDFRATLLGDNDTPFDVSSEELTGTKDVVWVSHDKEDVAVTLIHPKQNVLAKLGGHFLARTMLSSENTAPSRERPLTTLGFPLALGVQEHFSPITRDSSPASGLITLPRFDTHTPATFYLLENASIAGFSGAPVFLIPKPFATNSGSLAFPRTGSGSSTLTCVGIVLRNN
jgi:hypothetical protein